MLIKEPEYIAGSNTETYKKYPRQGKYTVEEFYNLTGDRKAELISGVIYDMAQAISSHQSIAQFLWRQIQDYIDAKDGKCHAYGLPLDVELEMDGVTDIFEPDVQIVCDKEKDQGPRIIGAPDFIAEILSPSTREKDMTTKLWKYKQGGVHEYWIIDPRNLTVMAYEFLPEYGYASYTFHDRIPVGIYEGDLVIDFEAIYQRVKGMYGIGKE